MRKTAWSAILFGSLATLTCVFPGSAWGNYYTPYCLRQLYSYIDPATLPNMALWCKVQGGPAQREGYRGDVDGVMGPNSWKGLQRWLQRLGFYHDVIDGVPGLNTYKAIQSWGAETFDEYDTPCYRGPIDGYPGPNTWRCFEMKVRIAFFTDLTAPHDGDPSASTTAGSSETPQN